ncbi:MAG: exodeoxyribonuclease VII large subunit [Balneolaceae bacterium]
MTQKENPPLERPVPTVSELTARIRELLESSFNDVLVEGEVSNLNRSRNGHIYFTVKDDGAQLSCVIWRSAADRISDLPGEGSQVLLGGSVQLYPPHGRYQLIVRFLEQAGIGRLQREFEALKQKLKEEGLFDPERKRPLPPFPEKIGVITSSTGAAFQDIRSTLEKRWPMAHILLHHSSVQGMNAAPELTAALQALSGRTDLDLLIIGRGGGSLEDLWPFNEESVARALAVFPVPVISAVGHETDFSISDFVADARAATPTQAAVMAVPDINEVRLLTEDLTRRIESRTAERIDRQREKLLRLSGSHALLAVRERLQSRRDQLRGLTGNMGHSIQTGIHRNRERYTELMHRLEKANPNAPLDTGFTRVWQDGQWIRSGGSFNPEKSFELEWRDRRREVLK